jgi:HTH-type transcriptional regulator, sugar sensing transcriptional regulator
LEDFKYEFCLSIVVDTTYLQEIGLSNAEIKVYLALLKLGSSTTGALSKETDTRKSTIYDSLNRLLEKGLVSYSNKNYVKYFEATGPERIIDFIEEKKRSLTTSEQRVKDLLPELKSMANFGKPQAEAHVFLGVEGFKTMRRDVLKHSNGELMLLGAISREDKVMPYFYEQWDKERIKKKIKFRMLHKQKTADPLVRKSKLMHIKFLPADIDNPVVINIYGDRVVSLIWKDEYPLCFMVINKDIAQAYKKYFEVLWKLSSKNGNHRPV